MAITSHQDIFKRLERIANVATLSPKDRELYEYDLKKASDYHAEISYARKKAMQEGLEEGIAIGMEKEMEKEKLQNALNLKNMGFPISSIAQALDLPEDIINSLE